MNCFRPSTVIPLLKTPLTVGNRGSSLEDEVKNESKESTNVEREKYELKREREGIYLNPPSIDISLVNKPGELPFGQHRVVEVQSGVFPDVRLPDAQGVDYPVELLVTIVVLGGPKSMSHTLQAVHNGAGKVVCWVDSEREEQLDKFLSGCQYPKH